MSNPTNLRILVKAGLIADEIAAIVDTWPAIHQQSMGVQIIRAADSIGNNISEGYGRLATGERMQFFFYADASLQEVRNQIQRSKARGLVTTEWAQMFDQQLLQLSISLIEFCWSILQRDKAYGGPYRERVKKRMWWRKQPTSTTSSPTSSLD